MYFVYGKIAKYLWVHHKMELVSSSEVEELVWIHLIFYLICFVSCGMCNFTVELPCKATMLLNDGKLIWCVDNKEDLSQIPTSPLTPTELDFHISDSLYVTT